MKKLNHIGVRELVEWTLRKGSIDYRYTSSKRMSEGTIIHQKLQKKRKKEAKLGDYRYESEFVFKHIFEYMEFTFCLEGRADGIIFKEDRIIIEEIKSTYSDLENLICDYDGLHFAQLKCYGYLYAEAHDLSEIMLNLTYCHVETEEVLVFEKLFSKQELQDFFFSLMDKYIVWLNADEERTIKSYDTIRNLPFPFENYRKGQREFAIAIYKTIRNNKKIFAQAATGTGKTISTLYPAIKSIPEKPLKKIFYLTAKTITRAAAESSLAFMQTKGLFIKSVTLTAKDKVCLSETKICTAAECPYADGHFDRVNAALFDILENINIIKRDDIIAYAEKHMVCPFEFSLDISLWTSIIIGDYNHVFDPKAQLKRFFSSASREPYVLLIDEAHNLVDRSREMFSAELSKREFDIVRKEIGKKSDLAKSIKKISNYFTNLHSEDLQESTYVKEMYDEDFVYMLRNFITICDKWLVVNEGKSSVLELYFKVLDYIHASESFDSHYVFYAYARGSNVTVKLFCLDPSQRLSQVMEKVFSSVLFSATLTPLAYFKDVLGGIPTDYTMKIPSPFDTKNMLLAVDNTVSTKYKDRVYSYDKVADLLHTLVSGRIGNYFAFFSSYEYMESVYKVFQNKFPSVNTMMQTQNLNELQREIFLLAFKKNPNETLLGFVVMGGVFSEGIDLVSDRLIGTAVVGVGIPLISAERNIISDYYKQKKLDGYKYAYQYAGMNKVLQSAGRVIRAETDVGIVLLIDNRFLSSDYLYLYPSHWKNYLRISNSCELENALQKFWNV